MEFCPKCGVSRPMRTSISKLDEIQDDGATETREVTTFNCVSCHTFVRSQEQVLEIIEKDIVIKPLTPSNFFDFEQLFGPKGAYAGCWCMWWRLSRKEFEAGQGEQNRLAMKSIVESGEIPGILAYINGQPCGWCSVAPRENYGSLQRSRILKPIDNQKVWSIVCLFIHKEFKGKKLSLRLIQGAFKYAKSQGGKIIEAYPTILKTDKAPPVSTFMGIPKIFQKAGFEEVHRPSPSKMIMRYYINHEK